MPIIQRPFSYRLNPQDKTIKKYSHFSILSCPASSPSTCYKLHLTNYHDLLDDEIGYIVAEANSQELIDQDFKLLDQSVGSMLDSMTKAEVRLGRMRKEQVVDLVLGVRELQISKFPHLFKGQNRSGFLQEVGNDSSHAAETKNSSARSPSIDSIADFVDQVEVYAESIKRLKKYAEYLDKHKNKPAKHAERSERKIRTSLAEMDKIEEAVRVFTNKNRRMSKRNPSGLESHQLEKTKSQFQEYQNIADTYRKFDVVKQFQNGDRSSNGKLNRFSTRDVYEDYDRRQQKQSTTHSRSSRHRREDSNSGHSSKRKKRHQKSSSNGSSNNNSYFDPNSFAESDDDSSDSDDGYGQQSLEQQLQTGQKFYVSEASMNTINVEEIIAREKREELEKIEADFNELVELNRDVNGLVHEGTAQIDHTYKNLVNTNNNITKGTASVKKAKKYTLKNAIVGGLIR